MPLKRAAPKNLAKGDELLFKKALNSSLKEVQLFTYSHVNVSPEGIVFKGLSLDKELLIYPYHTKIYNPLYLISSLIKRKCIRLPEENTYLLIFDYWSNSVFHWLCDALPRLEAVKEKARDCVLLLPENFKYAYIHESLKAFQFKDIYIMPLNAYVKCTQLISPEQITTSGEIYPQNFKALRKTLLDHYFPLFPKKYTNPNIYISRNKAKHRKVLNEDALLPILSDHKFELVYFEDMSFVEQLECCYHARNIISIHGANLSNVIFMQAGGNVLEFRKDRDAENNYFYSIADSVGCNYYYQNCETFDRIPGKNFFDLVVEIELFKNNLTLMLNAI